MRLWSLHPKYLDARGLVTLWREALLAQAVLKNQTTGYRHHPQLERFRAQPSPIGSIADYLRAIHAEAVSRGYRFDGRKISSERGTGIIVVTRGQVEYEWNHLMTKLAKRDRKLWDQIRYVKRPATHPLFRVVPGGIEGWEKGPRPLPNNRLQRAPAGRCR